jgi:hypothetical protein
MKSATYTEYAGLIHAMYALAEDEEQSVLLALLLAAAVQDSGAEQVLSWSVWDGYSIAPVNREPPNYDFYTSPATGVSQPFAQQAILIREAAAGIIAFLESQEDRANAISRR